MKKLSIFLACAVAFLGFTSCEEDKEPVYQAPTSFELNTPALENQYIELTPDGTFDLVAKAQPDYGYSAVTNYGCIVSLTPEFTEVREMEAAHQSKMTFKTSDLSQIICELKGIETEEDYVEEGPIPVYFKGTAEIAGVEGSRIVSSNYVCLKQVKYYFAVPVPGFIYLVGSPEGWAGPTAGNAAHYADWRLFEADNAIGSQIYTGVFDLPAAPMFRFYTDLTGWDADSYGSQEDDNPIDVEMTDGVFESPIVKGKGSFNFPDFEGGEVTIVVNMREMTFTMMAGAQEVFTPRYVYMVGNQTGWDEPSEANASVYENWVLVDKKESGIYSATFDFTDFTTADGVLYCRFYEALAGWGAAQWSADAAGGNVDIDFGTAMPTYEGEGCFMGEVGGTVVTITLDTNNNTVLFEQE
ncbi:MAG: SusE domain-containing protein [Muribaculaceae bacterium]|nr:SusE domain-containing protein [Muribaculaceae bacterium]